MPPFTGQGYLQDNGEGLRYAGGVGPSLAGDGFLRSWLYLMLLTHPCSLHCAGCATKTGAMLACCWGWFGVGKDMVTRFGQSSLCLQGWYFNGVFLGLFCFLFVAGGTTFQKRTAAVCSDTGSFYSTSIQQRLPVLPESSSSPQMSCLIHKQRYSISLVMNNGMQIYLHVY